MSDVPTPGDCLAALQLPREWATRDHSHHITPTIARALIEVREGVPPEAVAARYDLPWEDGRHD